MRKLLLLVQVLCVLAAVSAVVAIDRTSPVVSTPRRESDTVPVRRAVAACPGSTTDDDTDTHLFAVGPGSEDSAGELTVTTTGDDTSETTLGRSDAPGVAVRPTSEVPHSGARVVAEGSLAAGMSAAQWASFGTDHIRGAAASWCGQPSDSWWFNGVNTEVGTTAHVVLSNPTPTVAVVDLEMVGPKGPVSTVGNRGIAVGPRSRKVVDLTELAPDVSTLTLHVDADSGQVVAAVRTSHVEGITPTGVTWVPPAPPPSGQYVVSPTPKGEAKDRLVITNASSHATVVHAQALTADGPFAPAQLADVELPPRSVTAVDVSDVTEEQAVAFRLTADVDISAAIVSNSSKPQPVDSTVSSGSPALDTPAVIPVIPKADQTLAFVNSGSAKDSLTLTWYGKDGAALDHSDRDLPGQRSTVWEADPPKDAVYAVVQVKDGAHVHGAVHYTVDAGMMTLPIRTGHWTVTRPPVVPAR